MKNILITGSHGYIGSVVSPELKSFGYNIVGIDNGYFINCKTSKLYKDIPFTKKNVDQISKDDLKDIDVVIHLAGMQNDPLKSTLPGKVYDIEFSYSKKLAQICKELKVKFIYASSCSVYGTGSNSLLNEESKVNPLTPYSHNKLKTEDYLISISNRNFKPLMLRFATVYGYSPRLRLDLYINMFAGMAIADKKIKLNSDGLAWRPNLYIGDISSVLDSLININFKEPTIINVGNQSSNDQVVNVVKIIKNIERNIITKFLKPDESSLYGDQYVISNKDKRSYKVDFSKLNRIVGKSVCKTDLNNGIKKLISNLKELKGLNQKIKDEKFFRLQWIQKLINENIIDHSLNYNK